MGCWSVGAGRLKIEPEVTDEFICEYFKFSNRAEAFQDRREIFGNPWFIDDDNCLICLPGKYCQPSEWIEPVKDFLEKNGYKLIGDPNIIWEGEEGFKFNDYEKEIKYLDWIRKLFAVNCQYLK
ncbi:MAG: hypothetical protein MJ094_01545 [Saccharofermentans sp.]|nr:hypothetical protein [Saccharofermentans sp.]